MENRINYDATADSASMIMSIRLQCFLYGGTEHNLWP